MFCMVSLFGVDLFIFLTTRGSSHNPRRPHPTLQRLDVLATPILVSDTSWHGGFFPLCCAISSASFFLQDLRVCFLVFPPALRVDHKGYCCSMASWVRRLRGAGREMGFGIF